MIKDKAELQEFNDVKLPEFKGRVKITLKDAKTGRIDRVVEGENIVTNAVRDIMANNYLGGITYSSILPLWQKWYGGVLCYKNAHPTITVNNEAVLDPDDYFPQESTESGNPVTAHAGGTSIDPNHDNNNKRGNPVTSSFQYTANSIKQVWEWGTTKGNGDIAALSLTHKDTGDAGLGSDTYVFQNFLPLENISSFSQVSSGWVKNDTISAKYDDTHGLAYTIGDSTVVTYNDVTKPTQQVTIYIRKLPYAKAGLYETQTADTTLQTHYTVTTSISFYMNPCYYFDYATKRLWLFTNWTSTSTYSQSEIKYTVIDLSNLSSVSEYAHGTITSDANDIAALGHVYGYIYLFTSQYNIVKQGNYFCFQKKGSRVNTGDFTQYGPDVGGYKKINITNQSDQKTVNFISNWNRYRSGMYGGGLIVANGRVVNGSTGYSCQEFDTGEGHDTRVLLMSTPQLVSSYAVEAGMQPPDGTLLTDNNRYILANKMVNTTLFNLESPIRKASSQSMIIEYTLTQTTGA